MLSLREEEVVGLRIQGRSVKEISTLLAIAAGTVKTHLGRAFLKLECSSSLELRCRRCKRGVALS